MAAKCQLEFLAADGLPESLTGTALWVSCFFCMRLPYIHAHHAGNAADILKHTTLILLLQSMQTKAKPFTYVDTHAGAGRYGLVAKEDPGAGDSSTALRERASGIDKLRDAHVLGDGRPGLPQPALDLLQIVASDPGSYPGSPAIAAAICRPQDSLLLVERADGPHAELKASMGADGRVTTLLQNGYAVVRDRTICPAGGRRALVLIDPPYQMGSDTEQIAATVEYCAKHWAAARLAVWYPLARDASKTDRLHQSIISAAAAGNLGVLAVELRTRSTESDPTGSGMLGSGVVLVQPPYGIESQLSDLAESLASILAEDDEEPRELHSVRWLRQSA